MNKSTSNIQHNKKLNIQTLKKWFLYEIVIVFFLAIITFVWIIYHLWWFWTIFWNNSGENKQISQQNIINTNDNTISSQDWSWKLNQIQQDIQNKVVQWTMNKMWIKEWDIQEINNIMKQAENDPNMKELIGWEAKIWKSVEELWKTLNSVKDIDAIKKQIENQ